MSAKTELFLVAFASMAAIIGAEFCAIWYDHTDGWHAGIVSQADFHARECKAFCPDKLNAGDIFTCKWLSRGWKECSAKSDGKQLSMVEGSICPDLDGNPVQYDPNAVDEPKSGEKPPNSGEKPKPKPKPKPKDEDNAGGIASVPNALLYIIWGFLLVGGGILGQLAG